MPRNLIEWPGPVEADLARALTAAVRSQGLGRMIRSPWSMESLTPDSLRSQTSLCFYVPSGFIFETRPSLLILMAFAGTAFSA